MKQTFTTFYRLDRLDRIVDAGGDWNDFALENEGGGAIKERVIGTGLFAHIMGDATREFVWTMLDMVRKLDRPIIKPYRCDSPLFKRSMEMTITPQSAADVLIEHRLVGVEPLRRHVNLKPGASAPIERCSMCNRLRNRDKPEWQEPDTYFAGNPLPATARVFYGICQLCRQNASRPVY